MSRAVARGGAGAARDFASGRGGAAATAKSASGGLAIVCGGGGGDDSASGGVAVVCGGGGAAGTPPVSRARRCSGGVRRRRGRVDVCSVRFASGAAGAAGSGAFVRRCGVRRRRRLRRVGRGGVVARRTRRPREVGVSRRPPARFAACSDPFDGDGVRLAGRPRRAEARARRGDDRGVDGKGCRRGERQAAARRRGRRLAIEAGRRLQARAAGRRRRPAPVHPPPSIAAARATPPLRSFARHTLTAVAAIFDRVRALR